MLYFFFKKSSGPKLHMMIHSCDLRTQEEEVEEFEVSLGYTERTYLKKQKQNQNLNINTISLICNWARRSINICIQCCSKTTATQWGMLKTKRIMTKNEERSWAWWHIPVIPILRRPRQEDYQKFETSLSYKGSVRTARAASLCLKQRKTKGIRLLDNADFNMENVRQL